MNVLNGKADFRRSRRGPEIQKWIQGTIRESSGDALAASGRLVNIYQNDRANRPLIVSSYDTYQEIAAQTARQMAGESQQALLHLRSLARMLDRESPEWRRMD